MALFIDEQLPDFKKLRKDKKLTLRQVEEITGISNAYLSQLETGKIKSPSFDTVIKLLKIYIEPASGLEKIKV
jgi:transcriptional regulator with XRE-family HTH domain